MASEMLVLKMTPAVTLSAAPRECVAYTWYRNLLAGMIVAPDS